MRIPAAFLFVLIACLASDCRAKDSGRSKRQVAETIADACAWLKRNVGYASDGKGERWAWQTYNQLRYGV